MDVVYRPPRKRSQGPQPPRRTWFIREGTVVKHNGAYWMMVIESDYAGTTRYWHRATWDFTLTHYVLAQEEVEWERVLKPFEKS